MPTFNTVIPTDLGPEFEIGTAIPNKITVRPATTTVPGKVALATAADYPDPTNNADAATPGYVAAAIAAIPTLSALSSWQGTIDPTTLFNSAAVAPLAVTQTTGQPWATLAGSTVTVSASGLYLVQFDVICVNNWLAGVGAFGAHLFVNGIGRSIQQDLWELSAPLAATGVSKSVTFMRQVAAGTTFEPRGYIQGSNGTTSGGTDFVIVRLT